MDTIAGMKVTGRRLRGPASDIVEIQPDEADAPPSTAIVFHDEYRGHPALTRAVELAIGFMEFPMVAGLADLVKHDLGDEWFVYATGQTRTLTEVLKAFRDIGKPCGVRSGLEMAYLGGLILGEAALNGADQGVYSHGGLDPSRILVRPDGQVLVVGHGLVQIEIHKWRESGRSLPLHEDSFRYVPPERLEGAPEDVTSDLFALALIAYEMMTGKPLYEGPIEAVQRMALMSEGPQVLSKNRALPPLVREFLEQALQFDPSRRYDTPEDFTAAIYKLLVDPKLEGDPLAEVVRRVFGSERRGKSLQAAGETSIVPKRTVQAATGLRPAPIAPSLSARAPARVGADDEEDDAGENRWGKVRRRGSIEEEEEQAAEAARRRRRKAEPEAAPEAEAGRRRRRDEPEPVEEDALSRRRRRREEAEAPAAEEPRRRTRRGEEEAAAPEAEGRRMRRGEEAAPAAAAEGEGRRFRRGGEEAAPAAEGEGRRFRRGGEEAAPAAEGEGRRFRRGGEEAAPAAEGEGRRFRRGGDEAAPAAEGEGRRLRRGEDEAAPAEGEGRRLRRGEDEAAPPEGEGRRMRRGGDEAPAEAEGERPRRRIRGEDEAAAGAPSAGAAEAAPAAAPAEPEGDRPRRRARSEEPPAEAVPAEPRRRVRIDEADAGEPARPGPSTAEGAVPSDAPARTESGPTEEISEDRPRRRVRGEEAPAAEPAAEGDRPRRRVRGEEPAAEPAEPAAEGERFRRRPRAEDGAEGERPRRRIRGEEGGES